MRVSGDIISVLSLLSINLRYSCKLTRENVKIEIQLKLLPGTIVEWGELFLIELVDVLADVATVILDSIQGGDVTIPRNLKDK